MFEGAESKEQHRFSPIRFIDAVAAVSRADGQMPDPEQGIGRQCYAFSEQEDRAFDVAEQTAREVLAGYVEGKDYRIEKDAIGNMFIHISREGSNTQPVMIGSHLDSVLDGGKYDGVAGVAAGFDTLAAFASQRSMPERGLVLAIFRSEESSPHNGVGCLGSSIATATITPEKLNAIVYDKERHLTLREHITERYGAARWEAVLQQLQQPTLTPAHVAAYFEAHVEQSTVVAATQRDIGIVHEGIGGAVRERAHTRLQPERIEVSRGAYRTVALTFKGEPDHTGGTPPNPEFYRNPAIVWYRKDALVASCNVVNKILGNARIDAKLRGSRPERDTGFTSIPSHQIVELAVPEAALPALREALDPLVIEAKEKLGVDVSMQESDLGGTSVEVVASEHARQLMNLPQIVSVLSTKAFRGQGSETGTTRATITDYRLAPDAISYNLDLREVNEQDLEALMQAIHDRVELRLGKGAHLVISAKSHSVIDPAMSKRLTARAEQLGMSFVLMPSMPGHDADRVAAVGIPTAMVFIKQDDGVSHNPRERMSDADFHRASRVMRETVLEMLAE